MARIVNWTDDEAKNVLSQRLGNAKDFRKRQLEFQWEANERTVYSGDAGSSEAGGELSVDSLYGSDNIDSSESSISVAYAFKNLRFIHAQMSANPPSVVVRPTSNDQEDRDSADAADRIVRHALRQYKLQEKVDQVSLHTLLHGSGFMKVLWDSDRGAIVSLDQETGEMELEGDISVAPVSTWNMYIDPDAETWDDVRFVFERKFMPFEEALFKFGKEKKELLENAAVTGKGDRQTDIQGVLQEKYDSVEIYEYWEKGLPVNAYLGRYACHLTDGTLLEPLKPSPFRFKPAGSVSKVNMNAKLSDEQREAALAKIHEVADLPFMMLTDIDTPSTPWGKSFLEYSGKLQDTVNRLDATNLDNIQAHGLIRMVLPEGAEIEDSGLTNTPWDVIKITGSQPPHTVNVPTTVPIIDNFREVLKQGMDELAGVNESMFGKQSREQSGFSMQYAANQGNMIRRRLFNKYAIFVEDVYRALLKLVRKHWSVSRTITVLGKEKALEAVTLKGADIDGGFDLVVEYGASLSLDPTTRREEIMALQPMFEKAGVPTRVALQMLKLNELEGLYDMMQLAESRQKEIFEEMIAKEAYIKPRKLQDHANMLVYGMRYVMTTEFKYQSNAMKGIIEKHIEERAKLLLEESGGGQPPGPGLGAGAPGPAPGMGEAPPGVGGMQQGQPGPGGPAGPMKP